MKESLQRKYGILFSYLRMGINILITLCYTPILLRFLGQNEYGLYSLIASTISYLTMLDLGFGNAIIVYTSKYHAEKKYEEEKKLHGMFLVIFCIISFIAFIIGIILYLNVQNLFAFSMTSYEINKAKILMIILILNLVITFPLNIYSSIISAYEKFVFQKIISLISKVLEPLIMIPILLLGGKSISLVFVLSLINIFVLLSNYFYCKNKLNIKIKFLGFDLKIFKEIFSYSFFIFLGIIVDLVNFGLDNFILGSISGTIEVSIYSVASQFDTLLMSLSACCCTLLLPKFSKMVTQNKSDKDLNTEFMKFGRFQFYIMFLFLTGFIIFGHNFIIVWAGANYSESYYITIVLISVLTFVLIENIGVYIMQAKNLHKTKSLISLGGAFFNLIISIPLTKKWGAFGAALGTSISYGITNLIINNIYYQKKVKLDVVKFWTNIFKMSIPLFGIFICFAIFNKFVIQASTLLEIGFWAVIYSIIYFMISYFFCFSDYEKNVIKSIKGKILKN